MAEEQEVAHRNVRGKAKLAFLGRTRVGKLPVSFRDGVAIGPNSTELSALAERLGSDVNLLPFHFLKWPLVDIEYKDRVMMEIKQHFDFPDECNKYDLKQLNASWKDEKGDLKREYFIPFATRKDRIANRPDKVLEDQWTVLVEYWESPKTLDQMKELADKATDEGSSMYSTEHDDIFTQVMGPDSRGRKLCFGRATFLGELSNATSNKDNAEVRNLKGKVVNVQEELKSTKEELKNTQQQFSDL
ncbi:Uncharacterized protein Adt_21596 [Abeliophyllum distichum]|uniref:Uncharacterized protein n=1 Tax=Abeliophyllum distichum TaxID=126358 RepID=A0ABD1SZS4_9LAMI